MDDVHRKRLEVKRWQEHTRPGNRPGDCLKQVFTCTRRDVNEDHRKEFVTASSHQTSFDTVHLFCATLLGGTKKSSSFRESLNSTQCINKPLLLQPPESISVAQASFPIVTKTLDIMQSANPMLHRPTHTATKWILRQPSNAI